MDQSHIQNRNDSNRSHELYLKNLNDLINFETYQSQWIILFDCALNFSFYISFENELT